ncbi:MAG: restriction endonuclease [Pyrinomonadaceae bacterium]
MKNTGIEYEILVQSVFQEIHNQESAKNITVQRDVRLTGKSGITHQIDVFWEFEIGGIFYSTIVQAKDWKSSVKQEQMLALKSVLEDLPKQPRGIIVTKKGFQRGAKKFAESHGIELFELKEIPKLPPLEMKAGSFANFYANLGEGVFEIVNYQVKYKNITFRVENSWTKKQSAELNLKDIFESLKNRSVWYESFYNSNFQQVENVGIVLMSVVNPIHNEAKSILKDKKIYCKNLSHKFETTTYFSTKLKKIPFINIESVDFTVEITKDELIKRPFSKPGITTFVLKNILDDKGKNLTLKR